PVLGCLADSGGTVTVPNQRIIRRGALVSGPQPVLKLLQITRSILRIPVTRCRGQTLRSLIPQPRHRRGVPIRRLIIRELKNSLTAGQVGAHTFEVGVHTRHRGDDIVSRVRVTGCDHPTAVALGRDFIRYDSLPSLCPSRRSWMASMPLNLLL